MIAKYLFLLLVLGACGRSAPDSSPSIVEGEVGAGNFAAEHGLVSVITDSGECSGTYLGEGFVLTASHCFKKANTQLTIRFYSRIGDHIQIVEMLGWSQANQKFFDGSDVEAKPGGESSKKDAKDREAQELKRLYSMVQDDIALVRLFDHRKVPQDYAQVEIAIDENDIYADNTFLRVAGFGLTMEPRSGLEEKFEEEKAMLLELMDTDVSKLTPADLVQINATRNRMLSLSVPKPLFPKKADIAWEMASFVGDATSDFAYSVETREEKSEEFGSGACHGDSGGPVFVADNGGVKQLGITSMANCAGMTIFVNLRRHIDWIESAKESLNEDLEQHLRYLKDGTPYMRIARIKAPEPTAEDEQENNQKKDRKDENNMSSVKTAEPNAKESRQSNSASRD